MKIIENFPNKIKVLDPIFIELSDGVRLAARIWLPTDAPDKPVPAILEYLPYRRQDGTADRDATTHPYFAGHGYASVRVDMRGSGDSEGVLLGEYLKQEQDDGIEIINWITQQKWCSGNVGMIGISWGGFNGLQIAARQPEALKAIVSICSTDDRYADDIHHMGGCLLNDNAAWNSYMFSLNTTPPDPNIVGNKWHDLWVGRLKGSGLWLKDWMEHQTRDEFYKHGSVCEDYDKIQAAVYAVGGWADGYSNSVFRLLSNLKSPCKGLIGPWAHKYPHFAEPGPAIGFLQECLRWWDYWLKDIDTGIMEEEPLRCWIQDPIAPKTYYKERPGKWVSEANWPSENTKDLTLKFSSGQPSLSSSVVHKEADDFSINSPMTVGLMAGQWCPHGLDPDGPGDQRPEEAGSIVFDTDTLKEPLDILGAPVIMLDLSSDKSVAMIAVCLSEVLSDGSVTRVSYGLLNLTHRNSSETPELLEPKKTYSVKVQLNEAGHSFGVGNRIRVAISSIYWPIAWPSPERATITISKHASKIILPTRPIRESDTQLVPFSDPECAQPLDKTVLRPSEYKWDINRDMLSGVVTQHQWFDEGKVVYNLHKGWTVSSTHDEYMSIHPDDPLSAKLDITWCELFERDAWEVSSKTRTIITSTSTHFHVEASLEARQGEELVHSETWSQDFPRNHN